MLHIGAGRHSAQHTQKYKKLLRVALAKGDLLHASHVIEASALTNTGYGSSVDRTCEATSDASVLEIKGCRILNSLALLNIADETYPSACVHRVMQDLEREYSTGSANRVFGLSKPSLLDYKIYEEYVSRSLGSENEGLGKEMLVAGHKSKSLVLKKNRVAYERFKALFENEGRVIDQNQPKVGSSHLFLPEKRQRIDRTEIEVLLEDEKSPLIRHTVDHPSAVEDTVGYIEIFDTGNTTLTTSSGGNFYRVPGRASCAGILGSGIGYSCHENIEVSCMCSGNGDDIITMNLASYLTESIAQTLSETDEWPQLGPLLETRIMRKSQQVVKTAVGEQRQEITYVGVILIVRCPTTTRLVFCHSTESFYFGFRLKGKSELVLSRNHGPIGKFLHGEYKL